MGFLVAVVWIMAIADEVVNILQVSEESGWMRFATNVRVDFRLYFWTVRCNHWFNNICRGKFNRRLGGQYERGCACLSHLFHDIMF
jgi:hypothetical protein